MPGSQHPAHWESSQCLYEASSHLTRMCVLFFASSPFRTLRVSFSPLLVPPVCVPHRTTFTFIFISTPCGQPDNLTILHDSWVLWYFFLGSRYKLTFRLDFYKRILTRCLTKGSCAILRSDFFFQIFCNTKEKNFFALCAFAFLKYLFSTSRLIKRRYGILYMDFFHFSF